MSHRDNITAFTLHNITFHLSVLFLHFKPQCIIVPTRVRMKKPKKYALYFMYVGVLKRLHFPACDTSNGH